MGLLPGSFSLRLTHFEIRLSGGKFSIDRQSISFKIYFFQIDQPTANRIQNRILAWLLTKMRRRPTTAPHMLAAVLRWAVKINTDFKYGDMANLVALGHSGPNVLSRRDGGCASTYLPSVYHLAHVESMQTWKFAALHFLAVLERVGRISTADLVRAGGFTWSHDSRPGTVLQCVYLIPIDIG